MYIILQRNVRLGKGVWLKGQIISFSCVACYLHFTSVYNLLNMIWGKGVSFPMPNTVRSESRCSLRLRYVDFVVSIEVAVAVCCCFTVFSC
jgi:hypothetical protein